LVGEGAVRVLVGWVYNQQIANSRLTCIDRAVDLVHHDGVDVAVVVQPAAKAGQRRSPA
jgi:hypothetical protein